MPARERVPTLTTLASVPANPALDPHDAAAVARACERLRTAEMTVLGQIVDASNGVLLVRLEDAEGRLHAVYKPTIGERPLWDFPPATLAQREVATFEVSNHGGFGVVPPTVMREDGTHGPGSLQWWIALDQQAPASVDVLTPDEVGDGQLVVLQAEDEEGRPLVVVHRDDADLRSAALLDVVVNNADRKGSALLTDAAGHVWGIDHGICLHDEPKLRTILWGWAGEPLTDAEREHLASLAAQLEGPSELRAALDDLLVPDELEALGLRVEALVEAGEWPLPPVNRPSIPWPVL